MNNQLSLLKNLAMAVLLLSSISLHGCATNPDISSLSAQQLQRLSNLKVSQSDASRPHSMLDIVKGFSCQKANAYTNKQASAGEAIEGVKIRAVQLGADAVVNLNCQTNSDTDLINNCWSSIVCVGTAIEYTQ